VRWRHLGNSAAALILPETHFDLVRPGIAIYGLSPVEGDHGLVPAMTLRATLANVKRVRAGEGVSYGHTYTTDRETTLALVPLGYGDGIPRHASNSAPVAVNGRQFRISGRVCMDQFVVDVGDLEVSDDDEAVLFGPGTDGEPRAHDWAEAAGHHPLRDRHPDRGPRPADVRGAGMTDLVFSGGRVLGVDDPDGVVVVRDGTILAVGGPETRERAGAGAATVDLQERDCWCPASPTRTRTRSRAAWSVVPAT
jgi:hypothetical protein